MNLINTLKYYGRNVVLPVDEIKKMTSEIILQNNITDIVDFGSGTLFMSKWFAHELELKVIAVDTAYIDSPPEMASSNIRTQSNILDVLKDISGQKKAIFICDVIHHLPPEFWYSILPQITELFDVIIIKDIDAERKLGNFCNQMHDYIINREKIHDVYPDEIKKYLTKSGFTVTFKALPKLWYPHFITLAEKP